MRVNWTTVALQSFCPQHLFLTLLTQTKTLVNGLRGLDSRGQQKEATSDKDR